MATNPQMGHSSIKSDLDNNSYVEAINFEEAKHHPEKR